MFNKPKDFEEKNVLNIKSKQILEKSSPKKTNSNNCNNNISFEENENSENFEKNDIKTKIYISKEINKKQKISNDFKQKSLFGDLNTYNLSNEKNKNSLLFNEKPLFSNENCKTLFSGSSLFGDNNNDKNEDFLGLKKNKKEDKRCSQHSSGDSDDYESDSIDKKIENKIKKKKLNSKKKESDSKSDSSSSSNYHPEAHNFLAELLPYMSSDSEDEFLDKNENISGGSEKLEDEKIKKEQEKGNIDKKEENLKEEEKRNNINEEKNTEKINEKEDKTKEEKKEDKEKEEKEEEEKEENNKIIEFNENYNNTKNISSINYYTKKVKINENDKLPSYDYFELKNSDDILYGGDTKEIYDCKNKKVKLKIKFDFNCSKLIRLKENFFISVDSYEKEEIIIFHFEESNTKMVIDQKMYLPENKEFNENGPPIAPHLNCYPLNENYIIFIWTGNNNFYIYKNNSKEKDKIQFEQYTNIELNTEAFIYINTSLEAILRINDNEFCIFAKSDQRPEPQSMLVAFMQGDKKHKESTYFAVYSFNSSKAQFELKKSKINYEKGVDYYGGEIHLLRNRFIFYCGNMQKRRGRLVQIFDLETMQIIHILKNMRIQFYNISDKEDIFFIVNDSNLYEQYQIYNNGAFKKIGEARVQKFCFKRKYKNGIVCEGNGDYYLLTHE